MKVHANSLLRSNASALPARRMADARRAPQAPGPGPAAGRPAIRNIMPCPEGTRKENRHERGGACPQSSKRYNAISPWTGPVSISSRPHRRPDPRPQRRRGKTTGAEGHPSVWTDFDGELSVLDWIRARSARTDAAGLFHRRRRGAAALDPRARHWSSSSKACIRASRAKCETVSWRTPSSNPEMRVREMSKGMIIAAAPPALVMAIDARLLVLDEPTLGLDILYRKGVLPAPAQRLLRRAEDHHRDPHQVGEIEHILTDLMFIRWPRRARRRHGSGWASATPRSWSTRPRRRRAPETAG